MYQPFQTDPARSAERGIIRRLLTAAITRRGLLVSVFDGEGWTVKRSDKVTEVEAALATADDYDLLVFRTADGTKVGELSLTYDICEPEEVIADHTDNGLMEDLYREALRQHEPTN